VPWCGGRGCHGAVGAGAMARMARMVPAWYGGGALFVKSLRMGGGWGLTGKTPDGKRSAIGTDGTGHLRRAAGA
jgi:hypothetical protein